MSAYIPKYCPALGADWNCQRLYRLWTHTIKMAIVWQRARNKKEKWHFEMPRVALEHAMEQEKTLVVWVNKYKPSENWLNDL